MIKRLTTLLTALALVALMASPAWASTDPEHVPDGTWISLNGTIQSVTADRFELDYGPDLITVEMDDGDRDADAYALLPGDVVTVTGMVDDDFFESTSIEAGSVYVGKIDTWFFASVTDEEEVYPQGHTELMDEGVLIQGQVSAVAGDEFMLDTGTREFTVNTSEMAYDPLDDIGYQRIEVDDVVSVRGRIEQELFEGREVVAERITTLRQAEMSK